MTLNGPAKLVRVHFGEDDRWQGKPLYEAIVEEARRHDLAGATVYRGRRSTGNAPLATSSAKTTRPIFVPRTRMTFVAPRFPEPCLRRSIPRALPAMYAEGIDPAT